MPGQRSGVAALPSNQVVTDQVMPAPRIGLADRVDQWIGRVEASLAAIACALVLVMVVVICADVTLRATVRTGVIWANAVAEYSLYAVTFLAAPLLLRKGQHIRVDLLLRALPQQAAWAVEWGVDVAGVVISGLFAVASVRVILQSLAQDSLVIREIVFPEWWLYLPMPLSLGLLSAEFALRMRRLTHGPRRMREEATSAA